MMTTVLDSGLRIYSDFTPRDALYVLAIAASAIIAARVLQGRTNDVPGRGQRNED
jgi:hypothetical protein